MNNAITTREHSVLLRHREVRKILDGNMIQIRKTAKRWRDCPGVVLSSDYAACWATPDGRPYPERGMLKSPLGVPGDRLWVKETWEPLEFNDREIGVHYKATPTESRGRNEIYWHTVGEKESLKWQRTSGRIVSGHHIPRWASRITLEMTSVLVEGNPFEWVYDIRRVEA